jgi:hypothetical protein
MYGRMEREKSKKAKKEIYGKKRRSEKKKK